MGMSRWTVSSRALSATLAFGVLATVSFARAETKATGEIGPRLELEAKREKLDNGLRVVMHVDHTTPTIAVCVVYDVGARHEERGRSGFAHLFEHLMFQGSANVPRGDHFKLVTSHGGTLNGTTTPDRTTYFELLPSSELALALWLEADRMKALDVSEKNFENQRAVVKEEYRMRIANAAYGPAALRLRELVYSGYWPYEHPAIGSMRDLDAADLSWVRAFHAAHYGPNNAVLSISGDFDETEAMGLVKRYFANARPIDVPAFDPRPPAEQATPRSAMLVDDHAKLAAVFVGWAIPPNHDADHHALELAAMALGDGESSRLHRALVRELAMAVSVEASTENSRGPDMLSVGVRLTAAARMPKVRKLLETQIADLARLGPSDAEMLKLKRRLATGFLLGLQSNHARAQALAAFELDRGDARSLNGELAKYLAVTKGDIQRVVAQYLTPARQNVVEVKPQSAAASRP